MSLARVQPEYNLWRYVWKLLRLRVLIFLSGFRRARLRGKIGYIIAALFVASLLAGAFEGSWLILHLLRSPELAELARLAEFAELGQLLSSVPVLILSAAFAGILLTSFGVLLQALYLAGDMDFLLSTPVPIRAVFITKLLQAILPNFSLICLFGLPVLFGLGASGGYSVVYYPLAVIVLAALALAAAGLSSLLVMGVVRLFPARRIAEVLGFIGAIVSVVCSQSGQFSNQFEFSEAQTAQALGLLARMNSPWSPLAWAGRGLVDIGEGRWAAGSLALLLTLGMAGAVFGLALSTAERLYYTGWASVQVGTRRKKPARTAQAAAGRRLPLLGGIMRRLPPVVRGVLFKDFLVMRRDLRNMSQLVTPLIFGVIYAIMLVGSGGQAPEGRGEAPEWVMQAMDNALVYGNVGISLFVGWSLLSRLAMMSFSREGQPYWLLKVAPVRTGQLLLAKFLVAYVPTLVLGWAFLLAISLVQAGSLQALLYGLPVVGLCIAGAVGVNLAFGVAGANLAWEDPRHMVRGMTGCLGALASFAYMGLSLALFFGPPIGVAMLGGPEVAGQAAGLVLGGALSLACAIVPPWLVRGRVARLGEA